MLALVDQDGIVHCTAPGLADRARITIEQCRSGLQRLSDPDPDSLTQDHEGRRIQRVEAGWLLLNYEKYRHLMSEEDRREKTRVRVQRFRDRQKGVTPGNAGNYIAEADTEAKAQENNKNAFVSPDLSFSLASPVNGKKTKPSKADPRHRIFMDLIDRAHRFYVKDSKGKPSTPMFGSSAGNNLKRLLKSLPNLEEKQFRGWLTNYHKSENHNPYDSPAQYILKLPTYEGGPVNKFGRLDATD